MTGPRVEDLARASRRGDEIVAAALAAVRSGADLDDVRRAAHLLAGQLGADECGVEVALVNRPGGGGSGNGPGSIATEDAVRVAVHGTYRGAGFRGARVAAMTAVSPACRAVLDHAVEVTAWMVSRLKPGRPIGLNLTWSRGSTIMPRVFAPGPEPTAREWDLHDNRPFEAGMVLVAAPVLLAPGFEPISVEHTVVVTPHGPQALVPEL